LGEATKIFHFFKVKVSILAPGKASSTSNPFLMPTIQYVTDSQGKPLYVQIPVKEYEKLLAEAEELSDIAAYKKAKKKAGKAITFEEAFQEVEDHHRDQTF